jgi:hypothetical protein
MNGILNGASTWDAKLMAGSLVRLDIEFEAVQRGFG